MKDGGHLTAKAIGKRIKSNGLKQLKFYCQMCQKQCRDTNGFKCHQRSVGHLRQMKLFRDNPTKYIEKFSQEFESSFMKILRQRGRKRVKANTLYQEVIADKGHVHMNSTKWTTLSGFVQYLGKTGKAIVDETESGWYVQYLDKDPDKMRRQAKMRGNEKANEDFEQRNAKIIRKQIKKAKKHRINNDNDDEVKNEEFMKMDGEQMTLDLNLNQQPKIIENEKILSINSFKLNHDEDDDRNKNLPENLKRSSRKLSGLDAIIKENEELKRKRQKTSDNINIPGFVNERELIAMEDQLNQLWICEGIIVKIVNKKHKYYKKKGTIIRVEDSIAHIKLKKIDEIVQCNEKDLETVIPAIGKKVRILYGNYKGCIATMSSLNDSKYSVDVYIIEGPHKNHVLESIPYEHISKLG